MSGFCKLSSGITMDEPAIRHGVYITAAYILVFYGCIIGQARAKVVTSASYRDIDERVSQPTNPSIYSLRLVCASKLLLTSTAMILHCHDSRPVVLFVVRVAGWSRPPSEKIGTNICIWQGLGPLIEKQKHTNARTHARTHVRVFFHSVRRDLS